MQEGFLADGNNYIFQAKNGKIQTCMGAPGAEKSPGHVAASGKIITLKVFGEAPVSDLHLHWELLNTTK